MNFKGARDYLLARPEAYEDYPFGAEVAVMKIANKMFATLVANGGTPSMNLKCDPHEALILRDLFDSVKPGYHMNKRHWNTLVLDGSIPQGEIERMIENSFALVVKGLPRAQRQGLEIRHGSRSLYPADPYNPAS